MLWNFLWKQRRGPQLIKHDCFVNYSKTRDVSPYFRIAFSYIWSDGQETESNFRRRTLRVRKSIFVKSFTYSDFVTFDSLCLIRVFALSLSLFVGRLSWSSNFTKEVHIEHAQAINGLFVFSRDKLAPRPVISLFDHDRSHHRR